MKLFLRAVLAAMALSAAPVMASAQAPAAATDQRQVLPAGVTPSAYDLHMVPDAEHLTFTGEVKIDVDVAAPTTTITLNADHLTFDRAGVDGAVAVQTTYDDKLARATITFAAPISAGHHVLAIAYHGAIGRSTDGFFAMDYDTAKGKRRMLATNFEPTFERSIMPSWDEPALKANISLTVDAPADLMALSNMPVASSEALPGGLKRTHFQRSPKMSTYLFYFGLGDLERISTKVDGVDVGVVVARGETESGRYALGEAAKLLHFYNGYFGVKYPLPKLDLIAAPGEIEGGSMENWGAIFYSGEHLKWTPGFSTESDRQLVFLVVAHEMAHQWFGDLVTMQWWDNLWLNEGFARWMQTKAAVELHPEWKTGLQALAIYDSGKRSDAAPGTHPVVQPVLTAEQAGEAFDAITYNKGAAVITMLEAYAGPESFRNGVRRYMKAHAFGNTVDADLWSQVQAASGKPILEIEHQFTTQTGVPLVRVTETDAGGATEKAYLSTHQFFADPPTIEDKTIPDWKVPLSLGAGTELHDVLLDSHVSQVIPLVGHRPVVVNHQQTGYARVVYTQETFEELIQSLPADSSADQAGLLYDAWAEGQAGYVPLSNTLAITGRLPLDADPIVWRQVANTLAALDFSYAVDDPRRARLRAFARARLAPVAQQLGWDAKAGENSNAPTLRTTVFDVLSRFGDETVIAEARRRFQHVQDLDPAQRRAVTAIVARHATPQEFDQLIGMVRATNDPLQRQRLFEAISQVEDPALAKRVLDEVLTPDLPSGLAPEIVIFVAEQHPDETWDFMMAHDGKPDLPIATLTQQQLVPAIAEGSSNPHRVDDLKAYAEAHIPASARRPVDAAIAAIVRSARFRAERLGPLDAWLQKNGA